MTPPKTEVGATIKASSDRRVAPPAAPAEPAEPAGTTRPTADRRIAARRTDVARTARRRKLAIFGAIAIVVALTASGFAALHSPLFAARHVAISGATHEGDATVLTVTGLVDHPPLIDVSSGAAEAALEALPWVDRATVGRRWPESVSVVVTERTATVVVPVARGGFAEIDSTGRVLADVTASPPGLLTASGVGHVPAPGAWLSADGAAVAALGRAIPPTLRPLVATAGSSRADGLELTMTNGPRVLIGSNADLANKFTALATLLTNARAATLAAHLVDLRVPTSPVLTP